ncbi:MAG: DUF3027 domain-containing protein [Frankiales bacterium]|nr:DUF3027 domain-containing protein [Frankiales bacterium]
MNDTPTAPDDALAAAVDLARDAAVEVAPPGHVGGHVESLAEGEHVVTHLFESLAPGYRGWRWAVTVVRTDGEDAPATVAEVVLLPGPESLLAPAWVPWDQRVRPGDLAPGDLYPTAPDDPRLEPGYTGVDALEAADETASPVAPLRPEQWELGLGRETVLSAYGRDLAVERWEEGDFGPGSAMAKAAPGTCRTCGFLLPVGGAVGQAFGVCANSFGADGRVVSLEYGCGAHSSVREIEGTGVPVTEIVVDDEVLDRVDLREGAPVDSAEAARIGAESAAAELDGLAGAELTDVVSVSGADDLAALDADELLLSSRDDDASLFPLSEVVGADADQDSTDDAAGQEVGDVLEDDHDDDDLDSDHEDAEDLEDLEDLADDEDDDDEDDHDEDDDDEDDDEDDHDEDDDLEDDEDEDDDDLEEDDLEDEDELEDDDELDDVEDIEPDETLG